MVLYFCCMPHLQRACPFLSCGNRLAQVDMLLMPPYAVQLQYSLLDRRPENFMIPYCKEHNIKLLPYGTVAGGFLSERYLRVPASK